MTPDFPLPPTDNPQIAPFWQAAAAHRLSLPRRRDDQAFEWYPESANLEWVDLPGTGRLFSWVRVNRPLHPGYAAIAPYVSILVEPDGAPGVRLVSRMIDTTAELTAGAPVQVEFRDLGYPGPRQAVIGPLFRLAI